MGAEKLVLVVTGDELWGAERLRLDLSAAGYRVAAVEAPEIKTALTQHTPAILLANLSGELESDLELVEFLVRRSRAPVIAISPQTSEEQSLAIFRLGVTDFLVRPISSRELVARIHSVLRRSSPVAQPEPPMEGLAMTGIVPTGSIPVAGAPEDSHVGEPAEPQPGNRRKDILHRFIGRLARRLHRQPAPRSRVRMLRPRSISENPR